MTVNSQEIIYFRTIVLLRMFDNIAHVQF